MWTVVCCRFLAACWLMTCFGCFKSFFSCLISVICILSVVCWLLYLPDVFVYSLLSAVRYCCLFSVIRFIVVCFRVFDVCNVNAGYLLSATCWLTSVFVVNRMLPVTVTCWILTLPVYCYFFVVCCCCFCQRIEFIWASSVFFLFMFLFWINVFVFCLIHVVFIL